MKAYTYNDRLVGVGNDAILGTDQGGGSKEYHAGDYISIEDDVISVTGISAGDGTLSIVQDVTGAPLNINYPTDVAPDAVFYQINAVTGYVYASSTAYSVINYYYGETPADFNGSDDGILITVDDTISNVGSVNFYYTTSETGMGGPNLSTTGINGDSAGTIQSGSYRLKARYNQAGTYSNYGKYLQIMFNWRIYASDAVQCAQWAQEAMSKISFFGVVRPDPTLGVTVNLNRYYLSNNVNSSTPSSDLACQVTVDSTSKQQKVYLPGYMPSSWKNEVIQLFGYGNNYVIPAISYDDTIQYRAYKYTSSPRRYQFAYCTDWDQANKLMTFVSYDNSGNAIEKWTVDYTTYGSAVWTTTEIETGSEYTAGNYIAIDSNDVISVTGLAPVSAIPAAQVNSDWNANSGVAEILNKPTEIQLIAGANVQVEVTGASAIISAQGGGSGGHEYTAGPGIEINNYEISTTELASGLQLVAGDNVTMTVSGNNLVFSAAKGVTKTLLYSGSSTDSRSGTFTLSQSGYNFDRLEMTLIDVNNFVIKQICEMPADGLVNSNGTRGSSFNSITSGTNTWFKAMNWQLNAAGTTLTYWVDEISTSGNSVSAINRDQTGNRPIMLRIYGVKD